MRDFKYNFQRWLLVFVGVIAVVVAAMNYWYRVLPENAARERAAERYRVEQERTKRIPTPAVLKTAAAEPADTPVVEQPEPRTVDLDHPRLTLPDGRTLGFAATPAPREAFQEWSTTAIVHPWLEGPESGERISLPRIRSQRQDFTAILLDDGRLALIGGTTPRDVVALESQCADCPDEYIPFGEITPSKTTDIFDFESGTWSKGPTAEGTGSTAIRLRDGRIFKVSRELDSSVGEPYATDFLVEAADSKFTKWERADEARFTGMTSDAQLFESRNGIVMLMGDSRGPHGFHLAPRGTLKPWLEGVTWSKVEQLDESHLQLTQKFDETPPRYEKLIVDLP